MWNPENKTTLQPTLYCSTLLPRWSQLPACYIIHMWLRWFTDQPTLLSIGIDRTTSPSLVVVFYRDGQFSLYKISHAITSITDMQTA